MDVHEDKEYIIDILASFQSMINRSAESLDVVSKAAEAGELTPEEQRRIAKNLRNVRDRLQDLSIVLYALTAESAEAPSQAKAS